MTTLCKNTLSTRSDTLFSIRYAVRVLERHGNFWSRLGGFCKFVSIAASAGAVAAILSKDPFYSVLFGVLLALLQAAEFTLDPATRRAQAAAARKEYARLLAAESKHSDDALHAAYWAIVAEDEISTAHSLRVLAYNDVVRERGLNQADLFHNESTLMRWLT